MSNHFNIDANNFTRHESPISMFDREEEFSLLQNKLIAGKTRVAIIYGPPGVGKSTLAYYFANKNNAYFSGGILNFNHITNKFLITTEFDSLVNTRNNVLIIIDTLDVFDQEFLSLKLSKLVLEKPNVKIIITSRLKIHLNIGFFEPCYLELSPFSLSEFYKYIRYHSENLISLDKQNELFVKLQGNPLFTSFVIGALNDRLFSVHELLDFLQPFVVSGVLGPNGQPIKSENSAYKKISTDVSEVSDELLNKLLINPKLLYELSPRFFEQVVAEMLERLGYEITLTPASRDGGKDIYAAHRSNLGSFLYIVECKKYASENHVGVNLVRQLYGTVIAEKATAGILATTSYFTKDAKEFQSQVSCQISLQDFLGIQNWLQKCVNKKGYYE